MIDNVLDCICLTTTHVLGDILAVLLCIGLDTIDNVYSIILNLRTDIQNLFPKGKPSQMRQMANPQPQAPQVQWDAKPETSQ